MLYEQAASGALSFTDNLAMDTLLTFLLGLGIVFVGLIALVAIVKLMGVIMEKVSGREALAPAPAHVPAAPAVKAVPEPNHGELVAAVSAALATVMGTKVSGIRILSMKKVD